VKVDVDGVQSDKEITKDILLGLGDVGEEGLDNVLSGGELRVSLSENSATISLPPFRQ
jgi:DNA repair protein RadC